jgi:Cu-Zn family superoxide dismutase
MSCHGKSFICVISSKPIVGYIKFHQCSPNSLVNVAFHLHGFLPHQTHAIHIHELGNMLDGCTSLGPHYNPTNTTHGSILYPDQPRHAGDLINNLTSDDSGNFFFEYQDDLLTLYGDDSILGRSVVIHEKIDDLGRGGNMESLITGNAGNRIACAIIGRNKNEHF